MNRFNDILHSDKYNEYLNRIAFFEKDRIFCRHDLEHFLNVARIAYILVLENEIGISKELVYTTALLHDIGRFVQYENGTDHEIASAELAKFLLEQAGFREEEQNIIIDGIIGHRRGGSSQFGDIMYKSDKLSRECYRCQSSSLCNWKEENKNLDIMY